jgi:tetratricopeptide (TPR) repeat protein
MLLEHSHRSAGKSHIKKWIKANHQYQLRLFFQYYYFFLENKIQLEIMTKQKSENSASHTGTSSKVPKLKRTLAGQPINERSKAPPPPRTDRSLKKPTPAGNKKTLGYTKSETMALPSDVANEKTVPLMIDDTSSVLRWGTDNTIELELDEEQQSGGKSETSAEANQARELIETCQAELALNPDDLRASRLYYEIARAYDTVLGKSSKALEFYNQCLKTTPDHLPAIRGARRIYTTQKQFGQTLELFDAEIRVVSDPKRKAALYHAKGRVLEDQLAKPDQARSCYNAATELDEANYAVVDALAQLERDS